jgi:hypothetical protein
MKEGRKEGMHLPLRLRITGSQINKKPAKVCTVAALAYIKILFQLLSGGDEENQGKNLS